MTEDPERIWFLIAKRLAGEASTEELKELDLLLRDNPDASFPLDQLSQFWSQTSPTKAQDEIDAEADAEEAFGNHIEKWTRKKAAQQYELQKHEQATWRDRYKKPWLLYHFTSSSGLVNQYMRITWRNIMRSKSFSLINILGLAIGMASAILILLWMQNEFSMDRRYPNKERIFMVLSKEKFGDKIDIWGATPHPLGPELKTKYPAIVEDAVRSSWVASFVIKNGPRKIQTEGLVVDAGFLNIFQFPLVKGDIDKVLRNPRSIVITQKMAKQLFDDGDAMGKTIAVDSNSNFVVDGVLKDLPNSTSFTFDYLIPWTYMNEVHWATTDWGNNSGVIYLMLRPGISEQYANTQIRDVIKTQSPKLHNDIFLHPTSKMWLWSRWNDNGEIVGGRIETLRLFSIIAGFILLIACINYMNISTARSDKRAKEVGISKVVGAGKFSLIGRFLSESVLIAMFAGILALLIAQLAMPWFNNITAKSLYIPYNSFSFWLSAIGFILITGLLAGSYPAFYLSAFKPINVLQRKIRKSHTLVAPRKILVVFQFSIAIMFIVWTIVVYQQIALGRSIDPGYNRDKLAFVYVKGEMLKNYSAIKKELFERKLVTDVTRTNMPITDIWYARNDYTWSGHDTSRKYSSAFYQVEDRFIETMELQMVAGRPIDTKTYPDDTSAMMLTETAVRRMGLKQPIGEVISTEQATFRVVGVIKDFVPEAPFSPVQPIIIQSARTGTGFGVIHFRIHPHRSEKSARAEIVEVFNKHSPDYVVEYRDVSNEYELKFEGTRQAAQLAAVFAGLTIFICCLGLFALATYMAESRIKEIGVRKVMGASPLRITTLLSKDFIRLVLISFIIASPIAWWLINQWLKPFERHVTINIWVFVLTGLLSLLIAALSVGYQSVKAAMANPAKSLRSE